MQQQTLLQDLTLSFAGFAKVEKRVRTTAGGATGSVRNLRIREDTAKYLLNLDPNSAHYDPKSRSMREDPQPYKDPSQKAFAGDNFVRQSGDSHDMEALAVHSFAAHDKGQDIHMQGAPSQVGMLSCHIPCNQVTSRGQVHATSACPCNVPRRPP